VGGRYLVGAVVGSDGEIRPMRKRWLSFLAAAAAGLSGCAVGPDYFPPDISVPRSFGAASQVSSYAGPPTALTASSRWWQALNDRQLNALVEQAVACNLDIEAALTRVQRARTEEIVVLNAALPELGVSGGVGAGTGLDLTKGRVANSLRAGSSTNGLSALSGIIGFDGGWELDLFGKYRRLLEAAHDDAEALSEMRHAVLITVIGEVVRTYIEIRALQSRLDTLREDVTAARKVRDEVQTRYDQGLTNELDVAQAKRELATLESGLPDLTAGIYAAQNRMAVLLGTYSAAIVPELRRAGRIPHIPERLQSGTPLDLLRRRPDIRQAERELAAGNARIGASIADLFPTVAVTAGVGTQGGPGLQNSTPSIHGPIWSIGPSGNLPVLDFGRLDALVDEQQLRTHELLLNYKKTILVAVAEVDDAIKGYRAARQKLKDVETALAESRNALDLAKGRYDRGLTEFLNVVDAERQLYAKEDERIVAQEAVAFQFILLYKALGGGWERYDLLPPIREPAPAIVAMFRRLSNQWQ
jgi:NodT family efflux transporter outer membrane factor (OMF) lipoprotein